MREKTESMLGRMVCTGLIAVLILRCVIETILIQNIDIKGFSRVLQIENQANHIIETIIFFTFILFIVQQFIKKSFFQFDPFLDGALIGLVLLSLISFSYAVNFGNSLLAFQEFISLVGIFYIVSVVAQDKRMLKTLLILLIFIAVGISIYGVRQYFVIFPYIESSGLLDMHSGIRKSIITLRRVGSVFGWPNKLAGFLGITIPVVLGIIFSYFSRSSSQKPNFSKIVRQYPFLAKFLMFLSLFLLSLSMFFTSSIGGWLSLLAALFIEGILFIKIFGVNIAKESFSKRKGLSGAMIVSIGIILLVVFWGVFQKRNNQHTLDSISSRITYLKWTAKIIKEHPLLGVGIGNFKTYYGRYVPTGSAATKHAHNSFLEVWADIGIGGIVLFFIFIFRLLQRGLEAINKCIERHNKLILAGLFSGVCAFLIHNLTEFTFYAHSVSLYWWFVAGLLVSRTR